MMDASESYKCQHFNAPLPTSKLTLSFNTDGDLICTIKSEEPFIPGIGGQQRLVLASAEELATFQPLISTPPSKLLERSKIILLQPTATSRSGILVLWSAGNQFRKNKKLQPKVFRLPDVENQPISNEVSEDEADLATAPLDVMDHWLQLQRDLRNSWTVRLRITEKLVERFGNLDLGWCRLGDIAVDDGKWKLAMLAYRVAVTRADLLLNNEEDEVERKKIRNRQEYYDERLLRGLEKAHAGRIFRGHERAELEGLSKPTKAVLMEEGTQRYEYHQNSEGLNCCEADRNPTFVPDIRHGWDRLPRFFSWLVPHYLAGMSTPKSGADVSMLHRMGITLVITLTAEEPLPNSWFVSIKGGGIRNEFFPTANYFPPTTLQMDRILSAILEESDAGGTTLVHCGGGKGRAGTVFACYLALFGTSTTVEPGQPPKMTAHAAIDLVRSLRPGSIETSHQETFIERYVSLAWKRYGSNSPLVVEEHTDPVLPSSVLPLEITGDITSPDFILLVGLQGSGKSYFTDLVRLRNPNAIVASPDSAISASPSLGSASATKSCESAISNFRKSPSTHRVLILDRTNAIPQDRRHFLSLLTTSSPKCIAVFFDLPASTCVARAETRGVHPTLPPWRASSAIRSTAKLLQPPTLSEGFNGIATIRCNSAAVELANILFSPNGLPLFKFPRTKHILNLGSASRDDLTLAEDDRQAIFNSALPVIITEKLDGANMGFSLDTSGAILVQNRSHYIPISSTAAATAEQPQFAKLPAWVAENEDALRRVLMPHGERYPERYVLFGEWLYAVHTIEYTSLPSFFIAFDLFDRLNHRFLPFIEMKERVNSAGLEVVPVLYYGSIDEAVIRRLVEAKSAFGPIREGVVVRFGKDGVGERGKVVKEGFLAEDEDGPVRHWRKREVKRNGVRHKDQGPSEEM